MPSRASEQAAGTSVNIQGPSIRTDRLKFVLGKPNCAHEDKQNILRLMQMPASYGSPGALLMEIIYQACGFPYEVMCQATDPEFESSFWGGSDASKQTDYRIKKYADLTVRNLHEVIRLPPTCKTIEPPLHPRRSGIAQI